MVDAKPPAQGVTMPRANHRMHGRSRIGPGGLPWGTDPLTADVLYEPDEVEFGRAMEMYRRTRHRKFPTCAETLAVLKALGYRKIEPPGPLPTYTPADE